MSTLRLLRRAVRSAPLLASPLVIEKPGALRAFSCVV